MPGGGATPRDQASLPEPSATTAWATCVPEPASGMRAVCGGPATAWDPGSTQRRFTVHTEFLFRFHALEGKCIFTKLPSLQLMSLHVSKGVRGSFSLLEYSSNDITLAITIGRGCKYLTTHFICRMWIKILGPPNVL